MIKYIIALSLALVFSNIASAHDAGGINIKADKVQIDTGMSHKDAVKKMKCLLLLKDMAKGSKTKEDVWKHKMAKIQKRCDDQNLDDKVCKKIKGYVAKDLAACLTGAKFLKSFFGMDHDMDHDTDKDDMAHAADTTDKK